jgi:hypothetical protein
MCWDTKYRGRVLERHGGLRGLWTWSTLHARTLFEVLDIQIRSTLSVPSFEIHAEITSFVDWATWMIETLISLKMILVVFDILIWAAISGIRLS